MPLINSEVSKHKRQHLMIFIREGSVDHYNRTVSSKGLKLATVGLYKAVMIFMTSPNVPNCSQPLVNEIHSPYLAYLERVTTQAGQTKA